MFAKNVLMLEPLKKLSNSKKIDYKKFDQFRLKAKSKIKKNNRFAIFISIIIVLSGLLFIKYNKYSLYYSALAAVIVFFIYAALGVIKNERNLKKEIFDYMLNSINLKYEYSTNYTKLMKYFKKSGFVQKIIYRHFIEHAFAGETKNYRFTIGKINALELNFTKKSNNYKGLFGFFETDNNFPFSAIFNSQKNIQKLRKSKLINIALNESHELENKYSMWTENKDIANKLLTPKLREFFNEFALDKKINIVWHKNIIYFGIYTNQNSFSSIDFFKPITKETVHNFYHEFVEYYKILELFDLALM